MAEYTRFTNVEITGDLKMSGTAAMPAAAKTKAGAVKMASSRALNSAAVGALPAASSTLAAIFTAAEFKALLDALKAAGIMSST